MATARKPKKKPTPKTTKATLNAKQTAFLSSLRENLGIISKAAEERNLHRNTHYHWMKTNAKYAEEVEAIENDCIDVVENQLMNNILAGDVGSIIFYLKTKAKKRGYVERAEVDQTVNGTINGGIVQPIVIDWTGQHEKK